MWCFRESGGQPQCPAVSLLVCLVGINNNSSLGDD